MEPNKPQTTAQAQALEKKFNCFKCKVPRTSTTYEQSLTKHGRSRLGSNCGTCGSKMSTFGH